MTAAEKNQTLLNAIHARVSDQFIRLHGPLNLEDARTLRLAQLTLHRWAEEMCNGTIQREGEQGDGKPKRIFSGHSLSGSYYQTGMTIPDREAGALRRVAKVCKEANLFWFHQPDPRGCALWVAAFPLDQSNYNQGIACL